jgi:hypothetical protein
MKWSSGFIYNCLYHLTQIRHTSSCMSQTVLVLWCCRSFAMKVAFHQFTTILKPAMPWTSWTGTPCVHHILSQVSTPFPSLAKFYVCLILEISRFPHSETFYICTIFWNPKAWDMLCVCLHINKFCRYTGVCLHMKFHSHSSNGSLVITNKWK